VKLNWGSGIAIVISVFTIAGLSFIYYAFHQDVNLVKDNYYQDEIKYQDRIEEIKRTAKLSDKLEIKVSGSNILFNFPQNVNKDKIKGNILLYRPSDRKHDIFFPIELDSLSEQIKSTEKLVSGMWKAQVKWEIDTLSYYTEKIIMVQ